MWNTNYWHVNYWHVNYWAEDETVPSSGAYNPNVLHPGGVRGRLRAILGGIGL